MKKYFDLSPPIEQVEHRLVGINEGLIQAVERGETSPAIADVVRRSPEWVQYQSDLAEDKAAPDITVPEQPPPNVPKHILELIRRRTDSLPLSVTSIPAPGQIVLVENIVTPRTGQMDAILMAPLHVLLDAPAEVPAVWHGWLVSGETEYAGWWDFVLQEEDAPFDPEAAMVQLWNPVRIYLPMAKRVVGILSPARLQAVRAQAAEFVSGDVPTGIVPWPGRVAMRATTSGLRVVTGSPLGNAADVRHRYQTVYFEAAEAVREPARLALRAMAAIPATRTGAFLSRLISAAGKLTESLVPEPRVAVAMGAEGDTEVPDLSWRDIARLRIAALEPDGSGSLDVTVIGAEPVVAEIRMGSLVEDHIEIAPGASSTLSWDQGSTALILQTPTGRKLELDLRDNA
jgi:hypothetical protein